MARFQLHSALELAMKRFLVIFLIVFTLPHHLARDRSSLFVVWSVGQGLWSTAVDENTCHHFDVGGEVSVLNWVKTVCRSRENQIWLSHADKDHINFFSSLARNLPSVCWSETPAKPWPRGLTQTINQIHKCLRKPLNDYELYRPTFNFIPRDRNRTSRVVRFASFLIPGDSSKIDEKIWQDQLALQKVAVLVLGHHGSRTSTSEQLLARLKHLQMAVASARLARYGHPHIETVAALHAHGVPVLRTEDWGSLGFAM